MDQLFVLSLLAGLICVVLLVVLGKLLIVIEGWAVQLLGGCLASPVGAQWLLFPASALLRRGSR